MSSSQPSKWKLSEGPLVTIPWSSPEGLALAKQLALEPYVKSLTAFICGSPSAHLRGELRSAYRKLQDVMRQLFIDSSSGGMTDLSEEEEIRLSQMYSLLMNPRCSTSSLPISYLKLYLTSVPSYSSATWTSYRQSVRELLYETSLTVIPFLSLLSTLSSGRQSYPSSSEMHTLLDVERCRASLNRRVSKRTPTLCGSHRRQRDRMVDATMRTGSKASLHDYVVRTS